MATVLGVHVPELGDNPIGEVCHSFVYRYLVAKGNIKGAKLDQHDPMQNLMTADAEFLYTGQRQAARKGGVMLATSGSIILMHDQGGVLMHSMICIEADKWMGANNTTAFGLPGGRLVIEDIGSKLFTTDPTFSPGWEGDDNIWSLGSIGRNTVTFIDPPRYQ